MQNEHIQQLKERCLFLEKENTFYTKELISTKHALSQAEEALQHAKNLYQQLQADFENAIHHLQSTRK
jgi:type VII secretion effector (TIGR04197 family)